MACDGYTDLNLSRAKLISATKAQAEAGVRGPLAEFLEGRSSSNQQDDSDAVSIKSRDSSTPEPLAVSKGSNALIARFATQNGITASESRFFDYFRRRTVPMTGKLLESHFWTKLVLQLAHEEPAIKHAVLALGALHRRFEETSEAQIPFRRSVNTFNNMMMIEGSSSGSSNSNSSSAPSPESSTSSSSSSAGSPAPTDWQIERQLERKLNRASKREELGKFADQQYSLAAGAARELIAKNENTAVVLTACLIFVCYENLMGRLGVANVHRRSGERILEQMKRRTGASSVANIDKARPMSDPFYAIEEVFSRIDFQSMTLCDSRYPYMPSKDGFLESMPISPLLTPFENLQQAWGQMMDDVRWLYKLRVLHAYDQISTEKFTELITTSRFSFKDWSIVLASIPLQQEKEDDQARRALLQIHYETMDLMLCIEQVGMELLWDEFVNQFARIVQLAEDIVRGLQPEVKEFDVADRPVHNKVGDGVDGDEGRHKSMFFTLEPGVIVPLFVVAHRCRHPKLRRRAIALLRETWRVEGVWDSIGAAAVAERIMQIEEDGLGLDVVEELIGLDHLGPDVVKEEKRTHNCFVIVEAEKRRVELKLTIRPNSADTEWSSIEETLTW